MRKDKIKELAKATEGVDVNEVKEEKEEDVVIVPPKRKKRIKNFINKKAMEKETRQEHIKNNMTNLKFTVTIVVIIVIMLRIVESTSDKVKEKVNFEDNRRIL